MLIGELLFARALALELHLGHLLGEQLAIRVTKRRHEAHDRAGT